MAEFISGQRWVSESDLQLGLGTVVQVDQRSVTLVFPVTGETRTYAKQSAPLSRIIFSPGDHITSLEGGSVHIESIDEHDGLVVYHGRKADGCQAVIPEGQLSYSVQLNRPGDRLFSGQIDQNKWFELRYCTLAHSNRQVHSDLFGLTGARTSLIPHQLYIAHEVAKRFAPRVLLADEVGLGKTIEAGIIVHQQLLCEQVRRVLIVVPENLLHQWLVEMLRRFNLRFSLYDEQRCLALEEDGNCVNPFHAEQLVLCSVEFLVAAEHRYRQVLQGGWGLLVVDEAHHLQWSPQQTSLEYALVAELARVCKGVLLLTATPEQLGKSGHFARLRLLDPARFVDFDAFVREEDGYAAIAQVVQVLLSERTLTPQVIRTILATLGDNVDPQLIAVVEDPSATQSARDQARQELVEHLLDRHGTGRILFRNTRAVIKGFPERVAQITPLPMPDAYIKCLTECQRGPAPDPQSLLCLEQLYQCADNAKVRHWTLFDPRIAWLCNTLREWATEKVLVITVFRQTAIDIVQALNKQLGLGAAAFHEGMSIVERDRAAAYFADPQGKCQALVCSEIGSEGRNFQFAHRLILFDVPLHPDLLEQRIGRLDRIGQTQTVQLMVPYLQRSAQEVMVRWYHEGLLAFEHSCAAGHSVFVQLQNALIALLRQADATALSAFIHQTRQCHEQMRQALQRGRDRLLEYHSCRPYLAQALVQRVQDRDTDNKKQLLDYLFSLCDCFNIDIEDDAPGSFILRPSEHMATENFPGLEPGGMTVTVDRTIALANEHMQFISFEHPMLVGAMARILDSETGNTALITVFSKDCFRGRGPGIARAENSPLLEPGTLLLECIFVLESASSSRILASRYLPATEIRIVIDHNGKNCSAMLPVERIERNLQMVDIATAQTIVKTKARTLRAMLVGAEHWVRQQSPDILAQATRQSSQQIETEILRLQALARINQNVREEEVRYLHAQRDELASLLGTAKPRVDALRVMVIVEQE